MPAFIRRKLHTLKRTLRFAAALDGFAAVMLAFAVFTAADIALDRFFEFALPLRCVVWIAGIILFVYAVYHWIHRRCFTRIRDEQLANVFETFVPNLHDSLLTAIELEDEKKDTAEDFNPVLYEQTLKDAADNLQNVNIRQFFRFGTIVRRVFFAVFAVGLLAAFPFQSREISRIWFARNVLLMERDYPRKSQLIADGFTDGKVRIGRGDSFTLTVRANTKMPLVPDILKLYVGSGETGNPRTLVVDQFREEAIDGTDWRVFSYTFAECLESLPIAVRGADSRIDGLQIEVVPPPMLSDVLLKQEFPAYMNRTERTAPAAGRTTVPDGTTLTVIGASNKLLRKAEAVVKEGGKEEKNNAEILQDSVVQYSLPALRKDTTLEFHLEDVDNLRNKKPFRLDFTVGKDQLPVITAALDGIGSAITPNAVIPVSGEITDDYGLASAVFRYAVEKNVSEGNSSPPDPPVQLPVPAPAPLAEIPRDTSLFPLSGKSFSAEQSEVQPGDKLTLNIEATDKFDLDGAAGQTGTGTKWTLDVVTPEKLKGLLEVREIGLRQRFEVLIGEVEKTKALAGSIDLQPPPALVQHVEAMKLPETDDERGSDNSAKQVELDIKKNTLLETLSKEQADTGQYNISRTLRDTQKESYDTRSLVENFRLIRQEMINNKIFTDEEQQRLDKKIIEPMQGLFGGDFPELDKLTEQWNETLGVRDKPLRPSALQQQQAVISQFDIVLKKMTAIRDSMVSMESFNEAVEMLRAIIKQQQQLRKETLEEKNKRLKGLLE
ncbi:MAG: DUF4175 domain-containing protein [Planctomycetaceae bacterium]|jgi:hypothetical protein|nr:DUF4175 domain-containing protein [Planctomycetaceae bacterium]